MAHPLKSVGMAYPQGYGVTRWDDNPSDLPHESRIQSEGDAGPNSRLARPTLVLGMDGSRDTAIALDKLSSGCYSPAASSVYRTFWGKSVV